MKKILLIVTIPVIAILVVITVIAADSNYFPNKTAIEITGSTDNNFNNSFLSEGHMTYCNGNLYFWYASPWNYFKQGVFEVAPIETEEYLTAFCPELLDKMSAPLLMTAAGEWSEE